MFVLLNINIGKCRIHTAVVLLNGALIATRKLHIALDAELINQMNHQNIANVETMNLKNCYLHTVANIQSAQDALSQGAKIIRHYFFAIVMLNVIAAIVLKDEKILRKRYVLKECTNLIVVLTVTTNFVGTVIVC